MVKKAIDSGQPQEIYARFTRADHQHDTRGLIQLRRSRPSSHAGSRRISFAGAELFNHPPIEIQSQTCFHLFKKYVKLNLTRAGPGRGGGWTPPQVFGTAFNALFSAQGVKISDPGHLRSGHQVKLSDPASEKVQTRALATPVDRSL